MNFMAWQGQKNLEKLGKIMKNSAKYTIFRTKGGFFGLLAVKNGLFRAHLPCRRREQVKSQLQERLENCQYDRGLFGKLQEKIKAYFEGELVEFGSDVPVVLDGYSEFGCKVLETCRKIKYGETVSYGQLAKMAGRANAARAVGGVLGRNKLPLIIPCHRVIRADGGMGGFSAAGGVEIKEKMLELERKSG